MTMKAQAYFDNQPCVRIFNGNEMIAELPLKENTKESANESLRKICMRRTTSWVKTDWGVEANCFITTAEMHNILRGKA